MRKSFVASSGRPPCRLDDGWIAALDRPAHGHVEDCAAGRDGQARAFRGVRHGVHTEVEDIGQKALDELCGDEAVDPWDEADSLCCEPRREQAHKWEQDRHHDAVHDSDGPVAPGHDHGRRSGWGNVRGEGRIT